jgi:hypothetical protein
MSDSPLFYWITLIFSLVFKLFDWLMFV